MGFEHWVKPVEKNWRDQKADWSVIDQTVFANQCLTKLGSYPPTEWDIGDPSSCSFQRDGFVVPGKTFVGCNPSKSLGEDLHFGEAEKEFKITSFLK